jgi:exosome complex component RRP41
MLNTEVYNEFTGLRLDGRRPGEMRLISASINTIPGCTGSSLFKMGQTEVITQIFGPSEGKSAEREAAELSVSLEFADFAKAPHISSAQTSPRRHESQITIKRTFEAAIIREQFPGSRIEIAVTVVQDDGGFLAAAINAVTHALIDAGVPMHDFVVSLSAAYIADTAFLDTGRLETGARHPVLEVAVFPATGQIVSVNIAARIAPDAARKLTALAVDECLKLHQLLTSIVRSSSGARAATVQSL